MAKSFGKFTAYGVLEDYGIHEILGLGFILESEIWVRAHGWWQIQASGYTDELWGIMSRQGRGGRMRMA
jgi:hypothetical protein